MLWRKKPILVQVMTAKHPQYVVTLEGISEAKKGDYIVTGIDNEQWAIKPEWFHGSYRHVEGDTYQRIPQVLHAEQISEPETVSAPTGPIQGSIGDYKITGKDGEQWFCKPDIFLKTYDKVKGRNKALDTEKNGLQKSIDQLGEEIVTRYLPKGSVVCNCHVHGRYISHYTNKNPLCPLCVPSGDGNGVTATEVEHYIDIKDAVQELTSPFTDEQ